MKFHFSIYLLFLICLGCEEDQSAKFEQAGDKICDCMTKTNRLTVTDKKIKEHLHIDQQLLDYSVCTNNIGVDLLDARIAKHLKTKCSKFSGVHQHYLKNRK